MKRLKKIHIFHKHKDIPSKYMLPLFITIAFLLSIGLVGVSLFLYNTSGAAQLDLSRPGYVSVRSKASSTEANTETFSSDGKIDKTVIENFKKTFSKQAGEAKSADAFSGDPLSPSALGFDSAATPTSN